MRGQIGWTNPDALIATLMRTDDRRNRSH